MAPFACRIGAGSPVAGSPLWWMQIGRFWRGLVSWSGAELGWPVMGLFDAGCCRRPRPAWRSAWHGAAARCSRCLGRAAAARGLLRIQASYATVEA